MTLTKILNNKTTLRTFELIIAISLFSFNLLVTCFFLEGVVIVFSEKLNIVKAVELIFDIVNINISAIYFYIASCVMGVIFICFIIPIIKNTCSTFNSLIKVCSKNQKDRTIKPHALKHLFEAFGKTLSCAISYMIISIALLNYDLADNAYIILYAGFSIYIVCKFLNMLYLNKDLTYSLLAIAKNAILLLIVTIVFNCVLVDSLQDMVNGIILLFGGYLGGFNIEIVGNIYNAIVYPTLIIVLQYQLISFLTTVFSKYDDTYMNYELKNRGRLLIGLSVTLIVMPIIIKAILGDNLSAYSLYDYIYLSREYLPILFASISAFIVATYLPEKTPKKVEEVVPEVKESALDDGQVKETIEEKKEIELPKDEPTAENNS